jgi:hypothetical protein
LRAEAAQGRAPDLIEPVLGFRQWAILQGALRSPLSGVPWETAELHASCAAGVHDPTQAPVASCSCGVYAYYDLSPRTASAATADLVAGAVVLWGRLELHTGGMRASHARIVGLALPLSRGRKRARLLAAAERLSVPAVPHRQLAGIAGRHGGALPRSLRPSRQRLPVGRYCGADGLSRAAAGGLPSLPDRARI